VSTVVTTRAGDPAGARASEDFLLAFHRAHPGCTSQAFADGRIGATGSSYDLLVRCVPAPSPGRVLDLGCGDGHLLERLARSGLAPGDLVGVDLSPDELALASARPALAGAALLEGRGQALPLPGGSVGVALSHLAWMLMSDPEQVVAEIVRVLRPGGVFAAVVGGGPRLGDAFELFLDLLSPVSAAGSPVPRLGDLRCRTEAGLAELLGPRRGFVGAPRVEDFTVDLSSSADVVWARLSTQYALHGLPAAAREELRASFCAEAERLADAGRVPCSMFVRRVVAHTRV
jgi:SAM-dependent methyltransferase